MPGDKDIHNDPKHNTNGFKENPQNIGKGRPKKIYSVIKEMGYSAYEIINICKLTITRVKTLLFLCWNNKTIVKAKNKKI